MNWVELEIGLVICTCAVFIFKNFNADEIIAPAAMWFVFEAIRIVYLPFSPYRLENSETQAIFDLTALKSLSEFLLIIGATYSIKVMTWMTVFRCIGVVSSAMILFRFSMGWVPYGVLMQGSMDGCFLVALLPLYFSRWKELLFAIIAIFAVGQSWPLGCFFAVLGLFCLVRRRYLLFGAAFALSIVLGYALVGDQLFNSSGRVKMWGICMSWWAQSADWMSGMGAGSFRILGVMLSQTIEKFTFLHNDWLQILFEQGIIGVIMTLILYVKGCLRSGESLFLALAAYGLWGCANMPLRYPLAALYGAFLIVSAFSIQAQLAFARECKLEKSFQDLRQMLVHARRKYAAMCKPAKLSP